MELADRIAVVTGASRGGGRGIALALGERGATVYVTGRSVRGDASSADRPETIEETAEGVSERGGRGIPIRCDHSVDGEVEALFERIGDERDRIDILVNNAWGGYEREVGFEPFWEIPLEHWELMFRSGLRATMVGTRLALPLMLPQTQGLIVNTTAPVRERYLGNVFYDVAKTATSRMSLGMADDLRPHGIAVVALAREYGFTDIDGRQVPPFRELFPELFEGEPDR